MESTVRNMYKVLYDDKCAAVIMLSNLSENAKVLNYCNNRSCSHAYTKLVRFGTHFYTSLS